MIEAKIICDSINPCNNRLTTFVLRYPRFIHSEFMTHRMFSRNASSSRAIPISKLINQVLANPATPIAFTSNKKGMQGGPELPENEQQKALSAWLAARDKAVECAKELSSLNLHKQYANRILEPWAHISVICTATDYNNFFALRIHPDAQPEIYALAKAMHEQYINSQPQKLAYGEWHLPFIAEQDCQEVAHLGKEEAIQILIKRSVARCARVSYLNHDGEPTTLKQDLDLYDKLLSQVPIHASPAEHQAMALDNSKYYGNFCGWLQYRKTLPNENITVYDNI